MAIRIKTKDAIIEVDTLSEFSSVMREMGLNGHKLAEKVPELRTTPRQKRKKFPQRDYSAFLNHLSGRQREALTIIGASPEGATQEELVQKLNLKNRFDLAGTMGGGLAKNAKKFGFVYDEIVYKRRVMGSQGKQTFRYKLTEGMKTVMPL